MSDRSRDVSVALTEVRTVLSRAETALARLEIEEKRRGEEIILCWEKSERDFRPVYSTYEPDPDIEEMHEALLMVVGHLAQWRKAGSTGATRRRRWLTGAS